MIMNDNMYVTIAMHFVLLFKVDGEAVGPWLIQLCPSDWVKDGIVRTWD